MVNKIMNKSIFFLFLFVLIQPLCVRANEKDAKVILVTLDGLRNEDFFLGANIQLVNKVWGGVEDPKTLERDFWRHSVVERRKILMPFMWQEIAKRGQIFGNEILGSTVRVTNGYDFSYPGYNEMLTGVADPKVNSNELGPNPNVTVFEWLSTFEKFKNKVAALGAWETFRDIYRRNPAQNFWVRAGYESLLPEGVLSQYDEINQLVNSSSRVWPNEIPDALLFSAALAYLKNEKPKLMHVAFGESDVWGHEGRYDLLLQSVQKTDQMIAELWTTLQSMPEYKDQTTLIITTDHGRGTGLKSWRHHGKDVEGSNKIWMAFLGPEVAPLGERTQVPALTQSQIAATIAKFLGMDYSQEQPKAAKSIF